MCSEETQMSLCDLPHYALSTLISYLDTNSLYMLSQTCTFLREFVEDPKYWKYIDGRNAPNSIEKLKYCTHRVWGKTSHLLLAGSRNVKLPIIQDFFTKTKPYSNIKVMALEYQHIPGTKTTMKDFPSCLEEISLKGTYVENKYFFQHSWFNFPQLKVIILDECEWLGCDVLMSLSRYENLEIISAVKCPRIHNDTVPYLSVAKYGFKKLKVFDGRFTGIGGELLRTFSSHETIQCFYFQSFHSALLDYGPNCEVAIKKLFKGTGSDQNICDYKLMDYRSSDAVDNRDKIFDSFLYRDPYPYCTCGDNGDRNLHNAILNLPVLKDDFLSHIFGSDEVKFICKKHKKEMQKLPPDVRDVIIKSQGLDYDSVMTVGNEDDDDDDSDEEQQDCCSLYGMDTKVILLPSVHNLTTISIPDRNPDVGSTPNIIYFHFGSANRNADGENSEAGSSGPSTSQNLEQNASEENSSASKKECDEMPSTSKSAMKDNAEIEKQEAVNRETEEETEKNEAVENASKSKRKHNDDSKPSKSKKIKPSPDEPSTSDGRIPLTEVNTKRKHNSDEDSSDEDIELNVLRNPPNESRIRTLENLRPNDPVPPVARRRVRYARPVPHNLQPHFAASFQNINVAAIPLLRPRGPANDDKKRISLNRLSLRGYRKITDVTLDHLKHLNMDLLDLSYTSVTKEGMENFLLYNPDCRIIHPIYCRCIPLSPF